MFNLNRITLIGNSGGDPRSPRMDPRRFRFRKQGCPAKSYWVSPVSELLFATQPLLFPDLWSMDAGMFASQPQIHAAVVIRAEHGFTIEAGLSGVVRTFGRNHSRDPAQR